MDLIPRAVIIDGRKQDTLPATTEQTPQLIKKEILDILDWTNIFYRILEYKNERELLNIRITKEALKQIINSGKYTLLCDTELVRPKTFKALEHTTEIVVIILQKYLDLYHSKKRNAY